MRRRAILHIAFFLLLSFCLLASSRRPVLLVLTDEDFANSLSSSSASDDSDASEGADDWDDLGDPDPSSEANDDYDGGSWLPIIDSPFVANSSSDSSEALYSSGIRRMIAAAASSDPSDMLIAASEIEAAASAGFPHAQSALGFLYGTGLVRSQSRPKSFLYHHFAAEGGNMQSKMVLAYTYFRQDMYENAVKLYAELAEAAVASFLISKEPPVIEPVRIHSGTEENKEALRKSRGEADEGFQITEYQALKGNSGAMFRIGILYYYGLRGVRRDHAKALLWFSKSAEKGDPRAMELLGEMYARGAGIEKNYTKAFECFTLASRHKYYSAYNGLGYLYVKGYGVATKNYTKAREYFEKAAANKEPGGHYNLGVLYLKGIGVKRDIAAARNFFLMAANAGQPKALYQLARLFQKGIGFKKNLQVATELYKTVAERGPWSSLSRWALESYLKGDVGKSLLLYYRMAELGYEVGQSNAAWILDKYGEQNICMGESDFCTDTERHLRAHTLWWQASEQGNEHAALLIGDAYYYGRGTDRDYERAAEAYMHAQSESNAQAMFNLGYMHEHGQGLPLDLHLAKRYYDQAIEVDPAAKLPVKLALVSLWMRKHYADGFLIKMIDSFPELYPRIEAWVNEILLDEGNATILTLFACLLAVLYLRERQRRQVIAPPGHPDHNVPN
ncbi:ERAD-associated E3 ubiquitin-protein ligase component HRD3-like [Zingiber officinale]|uniref:ERAD-associated E3 ubiquitin-protein ligase component HRD3-like n=1 Tax=Zingiber officinale TaxID=94328 RepID=UPI001C4BF142|nr:ERAD-associated E3 ubiquitin-protein ligase component HRD3-like [Zingiber officinale]